MNFTVPVAVRTSLSAQKAVTVNGSAGIHSWCLLDRPQLGTLALVSPMAITVSPTA